MSSDKINSAIYDLENKFPEFSLKLWLTNKKRIYLAFVPLFIMISVILDFKITFLVFFLVLNFLYLVAQLFKFYLVISGIRFADSAKNKEFIEELPVYSILLPLYKENKVFYDLIEAIKSLDYPTSLLDVKLLIEEDDIETLEILNKISLPNFFEIIKIPISYPRTKPKACNYGLQFARGKYVTIYDAEDKPEADQLKKVVAKFSEVSEKVVCLQARLNFYNREENYITKSFSVEYSLLFDYMMQGLKKSGMPIPLGGTSNHFIKEKLLELGAWDAFNVTEDADLGIRLHHYGYETELLDSVTYEEAPVSMHSWIIQRARWIKGHILTSLVHLKESVKLRKEEIFGIMLCLYLPNLIYILLPIYFLLSCFIIDIQELDVIWRINLFLGILLPIFYTILIILLKKWKNMSSIICMSFLYYLLFPIAGIRAFFQIIMDPFRWDKTEHGVSQYIKS